MKIYTKTGDDGSTGLFGGERVSKASHRVDVYGRIDALNSWLGVVRAHNQDSELDVILFALQKELFQLGAELATPPKKVDKLRIELVGETSIARLEQHLDALETELQPLKYFVLPGGSVPAAFLHGARTSCRDLERALVALAQAEPVRAEVIQYVNRLSDLLFVMARIANHRLGVSDVTWQGR